MFRRFVRRARAAEPSLNAYVDLAKEEEEDGPTGPVTGLLGGVPLGAKASFCVEGTVSDACSDVLDRYRPPYTATAPARLLESGCRLVGKHNQDEFAMSAANLYSAAGPAVNPHSPGLLDARHKAILTPGGSSGGSAAAVAAGSCLVALGSDTGGSVRLPAAYCGVVGLKPTYGRLSRHGLIAFASSLDTPGVLARCVADAALALDAAAGTDPLDDTTVRQSRIAPEALPTRADIARMLDSPAGQPVSVSSAAAAAPGAFSPALVHARRPTAAGRSAAGPDAPLPEGLRAAIAGKRVGILAECHVAELPEAALRSWQEGARWLEDAGAVVVPVSVPEVRTALPAYYVLAPAEAASNLSRFDGVRYGLRAEGAAPAEGEGDAAGRSTGGLERMYTATRSEGFGPEVQRRILAGNFVLSAEAKSSYYDAAVAARRALRLAMEGLFGQGGVSHLAEEAALGVMLGCWLHCQVRRRGFVGQGGCNSAAAAAQAARAVARLLRAKLSLAGLRAPPASKTSWLPVRATAPPPHPPCPSPSRSGLLGVARCALTAAGGPRADAYGPGYARRHHRSGQGRPVQRRRGGRPSRPVPRRRHDGGGQPR